MSSNIDRRDTKTGEIRRSDHRRLECWWSEPRSWRCWRHAGLADDRIWAATGCQRAGPCVTATTAQIGWQRAVVLLVTFTITSTTLAIHVYTV